MARGWEAVVGGRGADLVLVIPSSAEACVQEKQLDETRTTSTISLHELDITHFIFLMDRAGEFETTLASQIAKQTAQSLALADLLIRTDDDTLAALRTAYNSGGL
eukprot:17192-Prymnesium_polylepis.2